MFLSFWKLYEKIVSFGCFIFFNCFHFSHPADMPLHVHTFEVIFHGNFFNVQIFFFSRFSVLFVTPCSKVHSSLKYLLLHMKWCEQICKIWTSWKGKKQRKNSTTVIFFAKKESSFISSTTLFIVFFKIHFGGTRVSTDCKIHFFWCCQEILNFLT